MSEYRWLYIGHRWFNVGTSLALYRDMAAQQTQNICTTFVQRRPNVFDVDPTLYKCYVNILCLLGGLMLRYRRRRQPNLSR